MATRNIKAILEAEDRASPVFGRVSESVKQVGLSVAKVGAAFAVLAVAANTIRRIADQAQQITDLNRAFDTLSRRIGSTASDFIPKLRAASRGLVSDMELMKQANNAIILGLPVTADRMADLTDVSIRLGRALGLDAAAAVESLITGIGRQSRLMLDNLGIVVNTVQAYDKYARELGKSASELTEAERKQAFFNETLLKARQAVDGLGEDSIPTFAEAVKRAFVAAGNEVASFADKINRLPERIAEGQLRRGTTGALGLAPGDLERARGIPQVVDQLAALQAAADGARRGMIEAERALADLQERRAAEDPSAVAREISERIKAEMQAAQEIVEQSQPIQVPLEFKFDAPEAELFLPDDFISPAESLAERVGIVFRDNIADKLRDVGDLFQALDLQPVTLETMAMRNELERAAETILSEIAPGFSELVREGVLSVHDALRAINDGSLKQFSELLTTANASLEASRTSVLSAEEAVSVLTETGIGGLVAKLEDANARVETFAETMNRTLGREFVNAAQTFGAALADAATGAEVDFKRFFRLLASQIAQAIARALVLRAILALFGPAGPAIGVTGSALGITPFAGQHGLLIPGQPTGRDIVPAMLSPGEAVLPRELTNFLLNAARDQQFSGGRDRNDGPGIRPVAVNLQVQVPKGAVVDMSRVLQGNHEAIGQAVRLALRRGTL